MKKILIPVTNHATLGDTQQENGTYAPELTHALDVFIAAGVDFTVASIDGGSVPVYGTDIEGDEINSRLLATELVQSQLANSVAVRDLDINHFDGIFYPGGFGLLSDLASDQAFAELAAIHYQNKGVIGAVCHGPGALLPITLNTGEKLLAGKQVTGFTREEEVDFGTINSIPFLLEERLTRSANRYSKGQPWLENVIVDDRLVTGQNPTSAKGVAQAIVKLLNQ